MPDPTTSCPICGRTLKPTDAAGAPPWLCSIDARAFWAAELMPRGRNAFDPVTRSYRYDRVLEAEIRREAAEKAERDRRQ